VRRAHHTPASFARAAQQLAASALLLPALLAAAAAVAQAQERVVAFPTQTEGVMGGADVDRALREALAARKLELAPAPALDLDATQLALDCIETSARCLRQVAERTHGDVLVAPSLKRRGGQLELRILYFAVSDEDSRFAARRAAGKRLDSDTVNAIPAMVDELFGAKKPSAAPAEEAPLPAPEAQSEPAAEPASIAIEDNASASNEPHRVPIVPLIIAGGGVVLVAAGALMGALMSDTQRDYQHQQVTNMDEAEKADELRTRGKGQALMADVLFGVGGAAIAAGGVWLVLAMTHAGPAAGGDAATHDHAQTAVLPELGPDHAGLRVVGKWSGL
jgi:hypothetical protein